MTNSEQWTARGFGGLSLALSAALMLAPREVRRLTGIEASDSMLRLTGAREGLAGVGLLRQTNAAPWLWARVLGDVADISYLGMAASRATGDRWRRVATTAGVIGLITLADLAASVWHTRRQSQPQRLAAAEEVATASIIVAKSGMECYNFWRNVKNLPRFMPLLASVRDLDDGRSHWVLAGPQKGAPEWDALLAVDEPGQRLVWKSENNPQVAHAAVVRFEAAPGDRGTVVRFYTRYRPLSGVPRVVGHALRSLTSQHLRGDLRRFKQLVETGEVATTQGQPNGRRSLLGQALQRWSMT